MSDYNNLLGLLGLMFAMIGIVITIKLRRKKSLKYTVISDTLVLDTINLECQIRENLRIFFGQEEVTNLYLFMVKFVNDGNLEISREDFKKPISIEFNQQARILKKPEIDDRNPDDILIYVTAVGENRVEVEPELMNSKEWFILKILITEYEDYCVSGRVAGIKKIREYEPSALDKMTFLGAAASAILSLFSTMFISERITEISHETSLSIKVTPFLLVYLALFVSFYLLLGNTVKCIRKVQFSKREKQVQEEDSYCP